MEEEDVPSSPFWLQTTRSNGNGRRRRRFSSLLLNSGFLIVFLIAIAGFFIFIIVPSILSFISQIFRPHLVKKSWDSINLVIVLFAVVCAFLCRSDNDENSSLNLNEYDDRSLVKSNPSTSQRWNQFSSDRMAFSSVSRLRNSSSYPDLRHEESLWMSSDDQWRFYDDTRVNSHRFRDRRIRREPPLESPPPPPPASAPNRKVRARRRSHGTYEGFGKEENGENLEIGGSRKSPPAPPQSSSAPPSYGKIKLKPRKTEEAKSKIRSENYQQTPPVPPPPPPPPPSLPPGGKTATKGFLISLNHQIQRRKNKKQRQKSIENFQFISPPPNPPPPPPLPPPSVFHNLFSSKKSKTKKTYSVPLPEKTSSIFSDDSPKSSGNKSPLIPIPPPPPLPPFKMTDWKFEMHGDYVRIKSNNSSRSGSPDFDDGEGSSSKETSTTTVMDGVDSTTPLFWSSPDVDSKADNFIARFRAGLRLEKMDSIGRPRSNLGP